MNKSKITLILMILIFGLLEINAQTSEIDSLENLLQKHIEADTVRINLLNQLASRLFYTDINKALIQFNESKAIADKLNFAKGKAESLRFIGICNYYKSDYPQALENFKESLKIYMELGLNKGISLCFNNIGLVYKQQGNYPQALQYFKKALKTAEDSGDKKKIAMFVSNMGTVYNKQNNYHKALESFQRALKIFEGFGNKRAISICLNNIGNIYYSMEDYTKTIENYENSLEVYKEIGDNKNTSICLNNLGVIFLNKGEFSKAIYYSEQSLKIAEEFGYRTNISQSLQNLGNVYIIREDYGKAMEYYLRSLRISEEIGEKSGICISYLNIGKIYFKTNHYNKAIDYTLKSLEIANELELIDNQKEIRLQLSEIYATTKNFKKAYENYVLFKELSDSIFNEDNIKKIIGLEYQYEYEKAKQAIELEQQKKDAINTAELKHQKMVRNYFIIGFVLMILLVFVVLHNFMQKRKSNRILLAQKNQIEEKNSELLSKNKEIRTHTEELKTTNKKLEELNATKDKFFSIVAHDLKSPFNSILGFSNLLLENHLQYNEIEREKYIKIIDNSAKEAYKLLDNLLNWARVQTKGFIFNPKEQSLEKILIEVTKLNKNNAEMKNIKLSYSLSKDIIIYVDYAMIEIILRNLISNAIKFTHKNGEVKINAGQDNDNVIIFVSDTGVGMTQEKVQKIFDISEKTSTVGTENEKGTGLGLILCKEFVEKHNGKIWIESEIKKGSKFIFSIPNNFN